MAFVFPVIFTMEHKAGTFFAEDHGANTAEVFFKSRRMKRARYIATANCNPESIKRRIAWYIDFAKLDK